jgi:hypothetical protein
MALEQIELVVVLGLAGGFGLVKDSFDYKINTHYGIAGGQWKCKSLGTDFEI